MAEVQWHSPPNRPSECRRVSPEIDVAHQSVIESPATRWGAVDVGSPSDLVARSANEIPPVVTRHGDVGRALAATPLGSGP